MGHAVGMRELSVENAELVKSLNWMRDNSVDNILFETFSVTRPGSSNEIVCGRCSIMSPRIIGDSQTPTLEYRYP